MISAPSLARIRTAQSISHALVRLFVFSLLVLGFSKLEAASLIFPQQAYYVVGNQDLEANTWTLGAGVGGVKVLFVSDPSSDVWFSGNNVRGRLYAINAGNQVIATYYGEITRLVKIGSTVIACQFYVYPNPADPANRSSPAQTLLINLSGTFTPGQTIKTSSDPVATFLNTLLPSVTSPTAAADADTAVEAGGLNNATPGSNAVGSLLTNDSGASTDYSINDSVSPPVLVETVGGIQVASIINTAATSSSTSVPAAGSVPAPGLYGSLAIDATGAYTYTVNNSHAAVEALRLSTNELQDVFTYTIADDRGNTSTSALTVTIQGANDTPIAADDYNFAKESLRTDATAYDGTDTIGAKAAGNILPNDTDVDLYSEDLQLAGLVATATGSTASATVLNISGTTANVQAGYYVFQYNTTTSTRGAALVDSSGTQIQVATKTPSISLSGTPSVAINNGDTLYFALKADGSGSGGTALVASTSTSSGTNITLDVASLTGVIVKGMAVSGAGVSGGTTVTGVTYNVDGKTSGITLSQSASLSAAALTFTAPLATTLTGRYGELVLQSDGSYVYTPFKNNPDIAQGDSVVDAFAYRINDLEADTSDAVLYITVLGSSPQDPNALADSLNATEAGGVSNATAGSNPSASGPGLLGNDTTPDGGTKSITAAKSVQTGTATNLTASSVTAPGGALYDVKLTGLYGDLYLKADGSYLYFVDNSNTAVESLKVGENLEDSFQYRIRNSVAGMVDWGLVTVSIAGAYDAPVAVADTATASDLPTFNPEGDVLLNDTDVDAGDSKSVNRAAVGLVDLSLVPGENVSPASTSTSSYTELIGSYGSLRIGADGSYVYLLDTSNAAVRALGEGEVMPTPDVFTYEVEDAGGLVSTTTVTVEITGSNDAPVNTLPASVALEAGEEFSFTGGDALAVSDIDDNLSSLRISVLNGILNVNEAGSSYEPVEGVITLAGGAKIYYKSASDGSAFVTENGTSSLTLYGTQAQINAALASLTYTPDDGFSGDDTLTLQAVDAGALRDLDSLTLSVASVPTVADIVVNEGSPYAVFTVSGDAGQQVKLSLINGTATSLDYGPSLEYWDGSDWQSYTIGDLVALPASGDLLVRTTITIDAETEGAHAFQLKVANAHDAYETGTCTIKDDGTGNYWIADATTPATAGDLTMAGIVLDDDRPLTVSSPTVNEASPYAVFKVCGIEGQLVQLALGETGTDYASGDAKLGVDTGTTLEYWDGSDWQTYTLGDYVAIPQVGAALNGEAGCLAVRVAINTDTSNEGAETFTLTASNAGGTDTTGTGTIVDDGTGDIYLGDNTDGEPTDPTDPAYPDVLDDDRPLTVSSPTVNEASPYAVFKVCGIEGQLVQLALGETGTDYANGDAKLGVDTGTTLEYWDGSDWQTYTLGDYVAIPQVGAALNGEAGCLAVRVAINTDTSNEGAETFTLTASNAGGTDTTGTGTIVDDGTGDIYLGDNTDGEPTDPTDPAYPDVLDDDRPLTVSSPTVNEASPYAVFKVCGIEGQLVQLALGETGTDYANGDAKLGVDTGTTLEYWDGSDWQTYTLGDYVAIPQVGAALNGEAGCLAVRVAINTDTSNEGAETFTLTASNAGGTDTTGTGTIVDDGTGDIYLGDNTDGEPTDPTDPAYPDVLDDDRPLTVSSPTVNEASPYAVFKVCGIEGQLVQLALGETGTDYANGDAKLGVDTGTTLEYWDGSDWQTYTLGDYVAIPQVGAALNGEAGCLAVRVAIVNETPYEGAETFTLTATNVAGTAVIGTGTIVDDGTGDIYLGDNTDGEPTDPTDPAYPDVLDDDRAVTVNTISVNEASPYAVFKVCGIEGQLVQLALGETGTDYADGDAELGVDTGTTLEYWDGSDWQAYTAGDYVAIPQVGLALNGEAGCLAVRVGIVNDVPAVFEDGETFTLLAANTAGSDASGTCTIHDDGTGDVYLDGATDGDPTDPSDPDYPELDDDSLHILKWGVEGADPVAGLMDATIIDNTTATPLIFAGMNDGRFDLHMTTNGLQYNGLMMIGGEASWAMNPRPTAATVKFRFYEPGTTTPHPIRNIYFSFEDAEVDEEFSNFVYWDASGNQVSLPWSDATFSYSHEPVLSNGDLTVHNGAVLIGKPQAGKWIRVDLRGVSVTGFQFSYRMASAFAGTVQMTHLCGEPGKFDFDVTDPDTFAPLMVKADASDQAEMPDYRSQMTWDPSLVGAVVSQDPAPGTLMDLGDHSVTMTLTTTDLQTANTGFVMTVRPAKKPVLAVVTPGSRTTTLATLSPYAVTGTVRDIEGVGIDRVEIVHNGSTLLATLGGAASDPFREWSLNLAAVEGLNELEITAIDNEGISSETILRSFEFTRRYALEVTASGAAGSVGLKVAAGGAFSLQEANDPTNTYTVSPAAELTLTAVPKATSAFSHWTGLPVGAVATGNQVVLTMPGANVSGIVAHFVTNPFVAPPGLGAVFAGLLTPVDPTDSGIATVGYLTGTLTSTGSFSGTLINSGKTDRFSATFYGNGSALFNLSRTDRQASLSLSDGRSLEIGFDVVNGTITATLTRAGVISTATLRRAAHTAGNKVDASLLNRKTRSTAPVNNLGFLTVALPAIAQSPVVDTSTYPQGSGYATVSLLDAGTLTLTGVLADGTTFTAASVLVGSDQAPVFAQLQTPGGTSLLGSLGGHLDFLVAADSDVSGSDLVWIRPSVTQRTGTTASAKATQLYTAGWPAGISLGCSGALYDSSLDAQTQLGLPAPDAAAGNAELQFHDGKLSAAILIPSFNVSGSAVTKIPDTDKSYTVGFSLPRGLFSGTFTPNWTSSVTRKPAFKGILVQKGFDGPAGYGFFHSNRSADLDPESGEVSLGVQTP